MTFWTSPEPQDPTTPTADGITTTRADMNSSPFSHQVLESVGPSETPMPMPMPMPTPTTKAAARPRRRWPLAVCAALLAFALGGGAVYLATNPAKTHLRGQRDTVQAQLDQTNGDLATAKNAASSAGLTTAACQRLVTDSTTLLGDWDKLAAIWQDPANQNVVVGSAKDQALSVQFDTIISSITFDRGLVSSDTDACRTAAKGV